MSPRPKTSSGRNWWVAGRSARWTSAPKYADSPSPPAKIVSARPDTIWLARSVIVRNAWISAIAAPESAAAPTARVSTTSSLPCTRCVAQYPTAAPNTIIPSTPRLSTPERSARSSPSEA